MEGKEGGGEEERRGREGRREGRYIGGREGRGKGVDGEEGRKEGGGEGRRGGREGGIRIDKKKRELVEGLKINVHVVLRLTHEVHSYIYIYQFGNTVFTNEAADELCLRNFHTSALFLLNFWAF